MASCGNPWTPAVAAALLVVPSGSSRADVCFTTASFVEAGLEPSSVLLDDLDGDGLPDLVVVNHIAIGGDTVHVYLNDGAGGMGAPAVLATGSRPYWVTSGDFDENGTTDLAVTNYIGDSISVLLNAGGGSFAPQLEIPVGVRPTMLVAADLDLDGHLDLAVSAETFGEVHVLLGDGAGSFVPASVASSGEDGPYGIVVGDFTGDGVPDVVAANYGVDGSSSTIALLTGLGDGTFGAPDLRTVPAGPVGATSGDFDHDGDLDVAVACLGPLPFGNSIAVLRNEGGVFAAAAETLAVNFGPYDIDAADLDGDGWLDLAVTCGGADGAPEGTLIVLVGDGAGGFLAPVGFETALYPLGVCSGDVDGNGSIEVAIAGYGAQEAWIHYNQAPAIVVPPADATVDEGAPVAFSVVVGGVGPFAYQWRRDGVDLVDGGAVSGAQTDQLLIGAASLTDGGIYTVVATNDCAALESPGAVLTVVVPPSCPADLDGSGAVDFADLLAVLSAWGPCQPCPEDLDASGAVDFADLLQVLSAWGPCP